VSRIVLADTGPLYALADPTDQFHARAAQEMAQLEGGGWQVAIPYPVLCEAYTLVLRRLGNEYALRWLEEVMGGAELLSPQPRDFDAAARHLQRLSDQPITLVDALVAQLAGHMAAAVWSYDHHFSTMRAKLWSS
jgi:predicted nucleic acid-binding protein